VAGNDLAWRRGVHNVDVETARVTPYFASTETSFRTPTSRWSRDGKALLFTRGPKLISRDIASGAETTLLDIRSLGVERFAGDPAFSPDGQFLAFGGWIGRNADARAVIDVVPIGGAEPLERLRASDLASFEGWTPDGRNLLYIRRAASKGMGALWRIGAWAGEPQPLGLEMRSLRDVRINRDGTRLTFTAGNQVGEVRVMEHFLSNK
jgi:Tol biopolymer transport system component